MNTLDPDDHDEIKADLEQVLEASKAKLPDDVPATGEKWEPKQSKFRIDLILVSLAMLLSAVFVYGAIRNANPQLPGQPITITACATILFIEDGSCDGDPPVQPGELVLTPELEIPVSGRVMNAADEDIAYQVTVSWVALDSDARITILDVPVTWEGGRNEPYNISWSPPPQLLQLLDGAEPGSDLGRWRIVGVATPVNRARWDVYQWDSIKTFTLIAPSETEDLEEGN